MTELGPNSKNAWKPTDSRTDLARAPASEQFAEFDAEPSAVRVNLAATALVVIDMQKLFCDHPEDHPNRKPIAPLANLIPALRNGSVPVIWVNWGNRPDEANLPPSIRFAFNRRRLNDPQAFLTKGSRDAEIVDELPSDPSDIYVDKYRLSGFWDTPLDSILRGHRIDTLLFAGVNLDQCVYHTLADAHFLGYDCILLKDCAATTSPAYCTQATIYNVTTVFGFATESTAIIEAIGA